MDDPLVILGAVGGALAGVLLLRLPRRAPNEVAASDPSPSPAAGYAIPKRARASAAPILAALGVTAVGVGLAIGAGDGGVEPLALLPGLALLMAALVVMLRGSRDRHPPEAQRPEA